MHNASIRNQSDSTRIDRDIDGVDNDRDEDRDNEGSGKRCERQDRKAPLFAAPTTHSSPRSLSRSISIMSTYLHPACDRMGSTAWNMRRFVVAAKSDLRVGVLAHFFFPGRPQPSGVMMSQPSIHVVSSFRACPWRARKMGSGD